MNELSSHWVALLNAEKTWLTDEAMLSVIPESEREFSGKAEWPRERALTFLANNVSALQSNHARLEAGEPLDLDLINPVLARVSLQLVAHKRAGITLASLEAGASDAGFNRGSAALRALVHKATFHFALYADWRLADPFYPGASPGVLRILRCPAKACSLLVVSPSGRPRYCSPRCAESTARPGPHS
jgi:hypothetical protein